MLAIFALVLLAAPQLSPAAPADPAVEAGVAQVREGEYDAAIQLLETAAARLRSSSNGKVLARAQSYLAIAYLGRGREEDARAGFVAALRADPSLEVTTSEFPPRIVEFFEKVKRELSVAVPGASTAERSRSKWAHLEPGMRIRIIAPGVEQDGSRGRFVRADGRNLTLLVDAGTLTIPEGAIRRIDSSSGKRGAGRKVAWALLAATVGFFAGGSAASTNTHFSDGAIYSSAVAGAAVFGILGAKLAAREPWKEEVATTSP
jgi:tetratricopeptide (TPR) repeat protein